MITAIKLAGGAIAVAIIGFAISGLLALGVAGQVAEWDKLSCGQIWQTSNSPFSDAEVCSEIKLAAYDHQEPSPQGLMIRWTEATLSGKRGFKDDFGRDVAGVVKGRHGVEVAYLPADKVCNTALRHEVRHIMILDAGGLRGDPKHVIAGWELFDGCR